MKESTIKVFAPASVANVAVGYDILGFALNEPGDEIHVRPRDGRGLQISRITGTGNKVLPTEVEYNTAGFAARELLRSLGQEDMGIEMEIHKKMPFGSGLGSSAASAAGAVVAVNELLGRPLSRMELLPFAVQGEQVADGAFHADNVAPSLLGGMVLIRSNAELDVVPLPVPEKLYAAVLYSDVEVLTKDSRGVLQPQVPLDQMITQSGNLAAFIAALYRQDWALLGRSLQDVVIEPQRARLIPDFYAIKEAALQQGAFGCSISGAGPSIFALCRGEATARRVGRAMAGVTAARGTDYSLYLSPVNPRGVTILE